MLEKAYSYHRTHWNTWSFLYQHLKSINSYRYLWILYSHILGVANSTYFESGRSVSVFNPYNGLKRMIWQYINVRVPFSYVLALSVWSGLCELQWEAQASSWKLCHCLHVLKNLDRDCGFSAGLGVQALQLPRRWQTWLLAGLQSVMCACPSPASAPSAALLKIGWT